MEEKRIPAEELTIDELVERINKEVKESSGNKEK